MRAFVPLALSAALLVGACAPTVPDSAAGVGFGDYSDYLRQRERALATGAPPPASPLSATAAAPATAVPPPGFSPDRIGAAIDAADPAAPSPAAPSPAAVAAPLPAPTDASRPRADTFAGIASTSPEVAGVAAPANPANPATISDENDFAAVKARETIQSDAARIARNRAQYTVVQPTAVPERPASTGPNIVAFAVSTTHAPGTPVYRRSGLRGGDNAARCARYGSPDRAQEAFLDAGGPERDRLGLDPDGDGFACLWDPRPFRAAAP